VQEAQKGGIDFYFWAIPSPTVAQSGSNVRNKYYAPRHAANFGIGRPHQHVLWRMDHGELDGINEGGCTHDWHNNTGKEDTGKIRTPFPRRLPGAGVIRNCARSCRTANLLLHFPARHAGRSQRARSP